MTAQDFFLFIYFLGGVSFTCIHFFLPKESRPLLNVESYFCRHRRLHPFVSLLLLQCCVECLFYFHNRNVSSSQRSVDLLCCVMLCWAAFCAGEDFQTYSPATNTIVHGLTFNSQNACIKFIVWSKNFHNITIVYCNWKKQQKIDFNYGNCRDENYLTAIQNSAII